MARKTEDIDVGGYLEGRTDIPETERTSIIRHSLMPVGLIPSEWPDQSDIACYGPAKRPGEKNMNNSRHGKHY